MPHNSMKNKKSRTNAPTQPPNGNQNFPPHSHRQNTTTATLPNVDSLQNLQQFHLQQQNQQQTTTDPIQIFLPTNNTNNNKDPSVVPPATLAQQLIFNATAKNPIKDPRINSLAEMIRPIWAESTWQSRSNLLLRFMEFLKRKDSHPDLCLDARLVLWVKDLKRNNKPLKWSTKNKYLKEIRSLLNRMGITDLFVTDLSVKATAVKMAEETIKQATPVTKQQMKVIKARCRNDTRLRLSLWLAWKTASRIDDIANLTKKSFHTKKTKVNEIVIEWGTKTKTTRRNPFRPTGFTVVLEEEDPRQIKILKRILKRLKFNEKLCPKTSRQVYDWLKLDPRTSSLSCHSFKRGAVNHLTDQVDAGNLKDARLIPLLSKHVDNLHQYPQATIRYISNRVPLARMFRTQDATKLL